VEKCGRTRLAMGNNIIRHMLFACWLTKAIFIFMFYIPWIFRDKPHLDIEIVNIGMNTLYNVMMCMP